MRTLKSIGIIYLAFYLLAACDPGSQRRLDRETFEQESRRREPRRIKEAEVIAAAMAQGAEIKRQLQASGQGNTAACCPTLPAALHDSLEQHHQASISCYPLSGSLPSHIPPLERQLLEAYQYNLEQQQPLEANVQARGKEYFIYTAPVSLDASAQNGGTTTKPCAVWLIELSRKQVVLGM